MTFEQKLTYAKPIWTGWRGETCVETQVAQVAASRVADCHMPACDA